ncbi:MAG: hypothetical protein ACLR56_10425 [Oscillospiraceae bacterium]
MSLPKRRGQRKFTVGQLAANDFKTIAFMPYKGSLERRYSFRYLKLKRTGSVRFAVDITALYRRGVGGG